MTTFNGDGDPNTIDGESGDDIINGFGGDDILNGLAGTDTLNGGAGNDELHSANGEGPDILNGGSGVDLAVIDRSSTSLGLIIDISAGGAGLDIGDGTKLSSIERLTFSGGSGADQVTGGSAGDFIAGGAGDDILSGNGGEDHLIGGSGIDELRGGGGDDTIESLDGQGADKIIGGTGFDTLTLGRQSTTVSLTIDLAVNNFDIGDGTSIFSVEQLFAFGGSGGDNMSGGNGADFLSGNAGNDVLSGNDGADFLSGGAGFDVVTGGLGADDLDGGTGKSDLLSYAGSLAAVNINLATNTVSGGDATGDTIIRFESVLGSAHDDVIVGNSLANRLEGGAGKDRLTGRQGEDSFILSAVSHSQVGAQRDVITDFAPGVDVINLAKIDAVPGGTSDAFIFIDTDLFTVGEAGRVRYFVNTAGNTIVEGETTGDGVADFQTQLTGSHTLTGGDFVL